MTQKILSSIITIVYLIAAYRVLGAPGIILCVAFLSLPLACIWFSKEMGSFTGIMQRQYIDTESPGWLVTACGWLLLLLFTIIGLVWYFKGYWTS
jgi:hypothetical protein